MKLCLLLVTAGLLAADLSDQKKQYDAQVPKTILELQQFRTSTSATVRSGSGKEGIATLINLNPTSNSWYLLKFTWKGDPAEFAYHLENAKPGAAHIELDGSYPTGLVIVSGKDRYSCDLLTNGNALENGHNSQLIYVPLCGNRIYLRNQSKGHKTALESVTEFVRNQLPGGESVIDVMHHVLGDRYQETGELQKGGKDNAAGSSERPPSASVDPQFAKQRISQSNLGITLEGGNQPMTPGAWYPAQGYPGIFVSVMRYNLIDPKILATYKNMVSALDSVEVASLVYLIAFDLDRYEAAYEVGTVHPKVDWGTHLLPQFKDPKLPGPDGIGTIAPLAATGLVRPDLARKTIATFTGGYKRDHSAFNAGDFAFTNHGNHYGIIENGVVMSKLQPGLATVYSLADGTIDMKSWTDADNAMLPKIRYARQNGVTLAELDSASGVTKPGRLVPNWGPGNWGGSANSKLRSIRASLAITKNNGKNFMIYAIFSDATPSSMARVYQSYHVNYAMLTDMNALEHTYMALYHRNGKDVVADHLLKGMDQLDLADKQHVLRFLGFSDNRDFFYIMPKGTNR